MRLSDSKSLDYILPPSPHLELKENQQSHSFIIIIKIVSQNLKPKKKKPQKLEMIPSEPKLGEKPPVLPSLKPVLQSLFDLLRRRNLRHFGL